MAKNQQPRPEAPGVEMLDPQGNLCTVTARHGDLKKAVEQRLAIGWSDDAEKIAAKKLVLSKQP